MLPNSGDTRGAHETPGKRTHLSDDRPPQQGLTDTSEDNLIKPSPCQESRSKERLLRKGLPIEKETRIDWLPLQQ